MPRQMSLNELSLPLLLGGFEEADEAVVGFACTMAVLVDNSVASAVLRTSEPITHIIVSSGMSLFDVLMRLRRAKRFVEEVQFVMSLAQKCPLTLDLADGVLHRFELCECIGFVGSPKGLLLCVVSDCISVSFLSNEVWDRDQIEVAYCEIEEDASIASKMVILDNASKVAHSSSIVNRSLHHVADKLSTREFWERKAEVFHAIQFGLDVESQVLKLDEGTFRFVMTRLLELEEAVLECRELHLERPRWRSFTSSEGSGTQSNPKTIAARTFRGSDGLSVTFFWHVRYGSSGRIHFIFNLVSKELQVGYVGPHLPLS
jgi:hypothetical protein